MSSFQQIFAEYIARTPTSLRMYQRALDVLPGGVAHDSRYLAPHPLYIERAAGAHKWDVDGNRYVDYAGGHGALLLGHCHPSVVTAAQEQLALGTQFGASHPLEVAWAEQIKRLVPSAERVRFTASGTEATLLAIRLARAVTGRTKIVRFAGHFHGWHDQVSFGAASHFDGAAPAGVPADIVRQAIVCQSADIAELTKILDAHADICGVILEPTGGAFGKYPLPTNFLADLRKLTERRDVLLIFDEVITGFRVAPGGAQHLFGVTPDLATFAKIVAGGLPGGAVAGKAEVMDLLAKREDADWNTSSRVAQQGTYNANPVSAAAGLATLKIIEEQNPIDSANRLAESLRAQLNEVLRECGSRWIVYGAHSGFHLFTNPDNRPLTAAEIEQGNVPREILAATRPGLIDAVRCALILHGVDIFSWPGGFVSAAHTDSDIGETVAAFRYVVPRLSAFAVP